MLATYYISTKRSEGVCSADVQVSLIEPLQKADVIVTLRLQRADKKKQQVISGTAVSEAGEEHKAGQCNA